mmetsp:Transcript_34150/g.109602  ORF Transcript_34150/g.109602 Transcript_34150/m.109602 type:complete len:366 (+) Transcript_34150:193-1290(+)
MIVVEEGGPGLDAEAGRDDSETVAGDPLEGHREVVLVLEGAEGDVASEVAEVVEGRLLELLVPSSFFRGDLRPRRRGTRLVLDVDVQRRPVRLQEHLVVVLAFLLLLCFSNRGGEDDIEALVDAHVDEDCPEEPSGRQLRREVRQQRQHGPRALASPEVDGALGQQGQKKSLWCFGFFSFGGGVFVQRRRRRRLRRRRAPLEDVVPVALQLRVPCELASAAVVGQRGPRRQGRVAKNDLADGRDVEGREAERQERRVGGEVGPEGRVPLLHGGDGFAGEAVEARAKTLREPSLPETPPRRRTLGRAHRRDRHQHRHGHRRRPPHARPEHLLEVSLGGQRRRQLQRRMGVIGVVVGVVVGVGVAIE